MYPPYLGTLESLIAALLHDPTLGSGSKHGRLWQTHPTEEMSYSDKKSWGELNPQPLPPGASSLIAALSLKEAASKIKEGPLKQEVLKNIEGTVTRFIDDYCGTPPHPGWPFPGPPPWPYLVASQLSLLANTFQAGSLRNDLIDVSARLITIAGGIR